MPYPGNGPRMEFSSGDRAQLRTLSEQATVMMNDRSPATLTIPVKRGDYDNWKVIFFAIAPTYNITGPWPDVR